MKNMEWQKVLVTLSTLIIVAHGNEGSCGSADKPSKVTQRSQTVRSHLRDTIHSVWQDEILDEQTNKMQTFFKKELDEMKAKIDEMK